MLVEHVTMQGSTHSVRHQNSKGSETTRERVLRLLLDQRYDSFTAGSMTDNCIRELLQGPPGRHTYYIGDLSLTFEVKP